MTSRKEVTGHKIGSKHELTIHAMDDVEFNTHHHYQATDSNGHVVTDINFQKGHRSGGINGITNEEALAVIIDRLMGFQSGATTACEQNARALEYLRNAQQELHSRKAMAAERHSESA